MAVPPIRLTLVVRLVLIASVIVGITACATTAKPGKTASPVDQAAQYEKAKTAFNQQKYEDAALLLSPLAEQGYTEAQYALGYMFYHGLGVPFNYKVAIQWLSVAAAKGNEKAAEALRRLSPRDSNTGDNNKQATPSPERISEQPAETVIANAIPPGLADKPSEDVLSSKASEVAERAEGTGEAQTTKTSESAEAVAPEKSAETQPTLNPDEQWIMKQPADNVTIQLMATSNEAALQRFISDHNLQDSALYYHTRRNGGDWYTLIQGSFSSFALANNALSQLTPSLQAAKPWIKPIANIQQALAAH